MKALFASCMALSLCTLAGAGCSSDAQGTADGSVQDMSRSDAPSASDQGSQDMPQSALPTEVMVMRVGAGGASAMVSNVATAAFIERHQISDGSLVGQAIALPTAASGANHILTLSGGAASEGALTRSADGRYILFAGYDAAPGTTSVVDNAMRVVGRLSAGGAVDTTTVVDTLNGSGNFIRSAASTDGNAIWLAGVVGIAYTTLGKTGNPIAKPLGSTYNSRVLGIYGGQLYVSRASDTAGGVNSVGTGLPITDAVTPKQLSGFPSTGNVLSPYGFVAFDTDATAGIDLLYIADDRTNGSGGVQRWTLNNTTWTLAGTMSVGASSGCRGLTGFASGSNHVLIATTSEAGIAATRLVSLTDTGATPSSITATLLATAATNTAYRGVALAPSP